MPDGAPVEPRTTASLVNLPNIITFGRLCAVPLAFWLVLEHRIDDAFLLFVAAGLSDALDGWLARRYGGNAVGALLDPVADKALLVTMYITLAAVGVLPDWLAILVVFRDMLIVGGVVVLAVLGHAVADPAAVYLQGEHRAADRADRGQPAAGRLRPGHSGAGQRADLGVALTTLASGAAYVWNTARGE